MMKKLLVISSIVALAACGEQATEEDSVVAAEPEAEAPAEVMSLTETTWTFVMDDMEILESIDADGNYIANAGDEHFDHGTYELVDGMQCFTSAMNDEGQECWTAPATMEIGESADITSDQGAELTVTRVEYEPLTM
ncbi:hypothetical protein [Aurantiacibacter gilvus]|uniref:DUF306 domain-containing protein n=1 Tax=Aurantiacibacter gilvus TaxID=3139141 RepID=A0ABU9IC92_9SPHN